MLMEIAFRCVQSQVIVPYGNSLFPEVEELLDAGTELQDALKYLASEKEMESYASIIDFIFCSVCPDFRYACRYYYKTGKHPLREIINDVERLEALYRMLWALKKAHDRMNDARHYEWGWRKISKEAVLLRIDEVIILNLWAA
jgi:hypothetical protein